MNGLILRRLKGVGSDGLEFLEGYFATTTNGTIDTTAGTSQAIGFTVAKTATKTGRYTLTCVSPTQRIVGVLPTLQVTDDTATTAGRGVIPLVRDDDINSDGTVELQFVRGDTNADAEVPDGAKVKLLIAVVDSNVV